MQLEALHGLSGHRRLIAGAAIRGLLWRLNAYQPVVLDGRILASGRRGCRERVDAVAKVAAEVDATSVIDLGCAEGYMVRRATENGQLAIGVDVDARRLAVAQLSLTADGLKGFGFVKAPITVETLELLPEFDVVVCLSLLHHVMYEHGIDHARELLRVMHARTQRAFLFEMGQSNESDFAWAQLLPDMGDDPHAWIAEFLESAGFNSVSKVAEVPSFNSAVARATFVASP